MNTPFPSLSLKGTCVGGTSTEKLKMYVSISCGKQCGMRKMGRDVHKQHEVKGDS